MIDLDRLPKEKQDKIWEYQKRFNAISARVKLWINNRESRYVYKSGGIWKIEFISTTTVASSNKIKEDSNKKSIIPDYQKRYEKQDNGSIKSRVVSMVMRLTAISSKKVDVSPYSIRYSDKSPHRSSSVNVAVNFDLMTVKVWPSAKAPTCGHYTWKICPKNAVFSLSCLLAKDHYAVPVEEDKARDVAVSGMYKLIGFDGEISGYAYAIARRERTISARGATQSQAISKAMELLL